jgi:hypothetical protein
MKLPEDVQFPSTIIISEGESASGSCVACHEHQGAYEIGSQTDLENLDLPPYHPNCVCEVEVQEGEALSSEAYGTTREMADVLLQTKNVFEKFTTRFKNFGGIDWRQLKFGGAELIYEWYASRLRGDENPEVACRARADLLLQEIKDKIPDRKWFEFKHVRGYAPNVGWNISHSWVELDLQYEDKHGERHEVKVKYDPYYNKIIFMDPDK